MEGKRKKQWIQILSENIPLLDTLLSLLFFSYLLISWVVNVATYSHLLFSFSLTCLIALILSTFLLDLLFSRKKKGFSLQILFNLLILLLYSLLLFLFTYILQNIFYLGNIIISILITSKVFRIGSLISARKKSKTRKRDSKIRLRHVKKYKIISVIFLILFCLPFIVFILGLTSSTAAVLEININDQQGTAMGSNEIQLSFYATSGSYDYLTDENVLSALNGSDIENGDLLPVEILLLVSDSQLDSTYDSRRLAQMVKNCTQSGLEMWIWFVYNEVEGHYPAHMNYEYMDDFKRLFDEWVSNFSLNIEGILFDNEMDELDVSTENLFGSLETLLEHRQEVKKDWDEALNAYKTAAEDWSKQGYEIALVGMDLTLLDSADNDPDIQQLYGIVNNPPDIWERVSFMFYRGCEYHSSPWGRDYLYNMAEYHKEVYGKRAVVAIGCMAYAAYGDVEEILKDIAILKHLDYKTTELFEFKAFYEEFGYDGLIKVLKSSLKGWKIDKFIIRFYTIEYLSRSLLFLADILLNLY